MWFRAIAPSAVPGPAVSVSWGKPVRDADRRGPSQTPASEAKGWAGPGIIWNGPSR